MNRTDRSLSQYQLLSMCTQATNAPDIWHTHGCIETAYCEVFSAYCELHKPLPPLWVSKQQFSCKIKSPRNYKCWLRLTQTQTGQWILLSHDLTCFIHNITITNSLIWDKRNYYKVFHNYTVFSSMTSWFFI